MSHFLWQENYKTGDTQIDAQHEQLFALANRLVDSETTEELKEHVMQLYRHTRVHFATEESLMKANHYPAFQDHVAMHDKLLMKLVALSDDIHDERWTEESWTELVQGFVDHIRRMDSLLADFLASTQGDR